MEGETIRLSALELVRPLNCIFTGVAVVIGTVVAFGNLNIPADVLILAFAAAALVAAGGNAINDYYDLEIDRLNRPERPLPSSRIKPQMALWIAYTLFGIGGLTAVFLNFFAFVLAAINSLVLALYAWRLKRRGLFGNLAIGYLVGSTFLFGGLAVALIKSGPLIPGELLVLVLMAALSTVGRELIKAIQDMEGDRKMGFRTFPLTHGTGKAAALAMGFIGAAIVISPVPYLLGIFGWSYILIVAFSIAAFVAAVGRIALDRGTVAAGQASLACKIGMGLGLLAFLAGALTKLI